MASYRLHGKNLSIINKEKEIEELEIWLRENTFDLNEFQRRKIQKDIDYRKFVNFKIDGKYKECIHLLLHSSINPLNIKNLTIFFTPVFILKKLLWYHQD